MTDAFSVDVGDTSHELVCIKFDDQVRNLLLHLVELLHHSVGGIRNKVHNHIQVNLIWLISISVETLPHLHAVWVVEHLEDGQLSVLVPFVLEHFLDGDCFSGLGDGGLEYHTKRAIANDLFSVVSKALK